MVLLNHDELVAEHGRVDLDGAQGGVELPGVGFRVGVLGDHEESVCVCGCIYIIVRSMVNSGQWVFVIRLLE